MKKKRKKVRKPRSKKPQTKATREPAPTPSTPAPIAEIDALDLAVNDGAVAALPPGAQPPTDPDQEPTYAFPSKSRCPRCKGLYNTVYCTRGELRYYKCLHAFCRATWRIKGALI